MKSVHRIDGDRRIKVADFGLAREVNVRDYFRIPEDDRSPLPFRWMAIESLEEQVFTTKSDVVSKIIYLMKMKDFGVGSKRGYELKC